MSKGFTIIELIISIFILSVALVGIFSAFYTVTILTSDSADKLTATYLAQEGMEIVRNIRDTNWLNMDTYCATHDCSTGNAYSWVDGLTSVGACGNVGTGCEADYTSLASMSGNSGQYLCIDSNGFYYYTSSCPSSSTTKFERKIIITPVTDVDTKSDHIIKVVVQVAWDGRGSILHSSRNADYGISNCNTTDNCVSAEETLYDWYNYVNH
jgi:prepilin-type N-terminal cleavage/methylation domain-containing protein